MSKSHRKTICGRYHVESIVGKKVRSGETLYEVKWKGYSDSENTWEPKCHLKGCSDLIQEYEARYKIRKSSFSDDQFEDFSFEKIEKRRKTSSSRRKTNSQQSMANPRHSLLPQSPVACIVPTQVKSMKLDEENEVFLDVEFENNGTTKRGGMTHEILKELNPKMLCDFYKAQLVRLNLEYASQQKMGVKMEYNAVIDLVSETNGSTRNSFDS